MIQSESGNQTPSPSSSLPLLQTTNPMKRMEFDDLIAKDSEMIQSESGNQALSPSSFLFCKRLIQGGEKDGI